MNPATHDATVIMRDAAALSPDDLLALLIDAMHRGVSWQASHGMVQRPGPSLPVLILDLESGSSLFIAPDTGLRLAALIEADARWANGAAIGALLRNAAGAAVAMAALHDTLSNRPAKET